MPEVPDFHRCAAGANPHGTQILLGRLGRIDDRGIVARRAIEWRHTPIDPEHQLVIDIGEPY